MKKLLFVTLLALPMLLLTNCDSDDENNDPTPQEVSKTYQLASVADPTISGTAKFIKNDDDSVTVELQLTGTPAGGMHPAHIHNNTAVESGGIAVTLGTVDGDTGFSTVTFTELDDTTAVSYDDMIAFDGYINVHLSSTELATLVAQGDIGQNELTGATTTYDIDEVNGSGVSGTATLSERNNGQTLLALVISGTAAGTNHTTQINDGSIATPGTLAISLTNVNGETGLSLTNVSRKDDDTPVTYQELILYDGHLNIQANETSFVNVAQGDIGQNTLN